ncbi:TetR family transcriptional regulator [Actinoplanes sp. SE50]|uniref:TetR/AcrR family transcriptional regulator n=1 Tax=unclassified Actinoplanes TaxID=2626549 RepID=UPI00023ED5C9|nr:MULTISPECIES: TetR/AcrR family transcriptional regulator [unclassified Actinoplanes]AEV83934.1 HTH-type transcriptional regulator betI [Actinoplanes sp. SE50/110]ATO81922.1 TetR family transcriptional regulator [Actinoplanes sp. SE50]SLL99330.1 TetR family transcriptional regulator [Actinoplanes sp. SE50/110]
MSRIRLTAAERQEQIVAAALQAFAQGGYVGTSTDEVARLSGVSQPYVIRIFGSKQELFLATVRYAGQRIEATWRAAADREPTLASLGSAYTDLLAERELLAVLLHGFAASADPVVGDAVRACYGNMYQTVRDLTGATPEEARDFFAMGMLITVLGTMRILGPGAVPPQPWMTSLLSTFPDHTA